MHRMSTLIFILVIGIISMRQSTTAQTTGMSTVDQTTGTSTVTATGTSSGTSTTHIGLLDALGNSMSFAFTVNPDPPGGHITQATTIVHGLATIPGSTVTQNTEGRGNLTNITITAMGTPIIKAISITPKAQGNLPPPPRAPLQVSLELHGTASTEDFWVVVSLVGCSGEAFSLNTNGLSISAILDALARQINKTCPMTAAVTDHKLIVDHVEPGTKFVVSLGDPELEVTFLVDLVF
jgi:hypothetical protein